MASFSERMGITKPSTMLQTDEISTELRNSLWNILHATFENNRVSREYWITLTRQIAVHFRKVPVDEIPKYNSRCREWIKRYFYELEWNKAYELFEFILSTNISGRNANKYKDDVVASLNRVLETELAGYRYISGEFAPITNSTETAEVESALSTTSSGRFSGANEHLQTALHLLSKKPEPDYRNSIKESISAVESVAKVISAKGGRGLAEPLKELATQVDMHPALMKGFNNLYGYTSDEGGIRHAILDATTVGFDEAKYMLVSCSAFVNYLISKTQLIEKEAK